MKAINPTAPRGRGVLGSTLLVGVTGALSLCLAGGAQAASAGSDAQLREAWQAAIARTPQPRAGCFTAAYPSASWAEVACVTAPDTPYVPRTGGVRGGRGFTVGNGNDYSAVVTGKISKTVGSFPSVTGVRKETGAGGAANTYSLQVNSQFFASPTCSGASNPPSCLGWQQFVYSNSGVAFMQYWLISYGSKCPTGGWMAFSGDCYRNSAAVGVPKQAIAQLSHLQVTGTAVASGNDTIVMTTASNAYSASGNDNVVDLAGFWNASEFNIIGDGGGSSAKFNKGSTVTVKIALTDGLTSVPTCQPHDGTTGETNNLTLGACTTAGGSTPSVTFTESN